MKNTTKAKSAKEIAVLVTTEYRGVFFGYMDPRRVNDETIELRRARNCLYWSAATGGFLGLTTRGPDADCRVGPPADVKSLRKITCVATVEPEAIAKWEASPWAK